MREPFDCIEREDSRGEGKGVVNSGIDQPICGGEMEQRAFVGGEVEVVPRVAGAESCVVMEGVHGTGHSWVFELLTQELLGDLIQSSSTVWRERLESWHMAY